MGNNNQEASLQKLNDIIQPLQELNNKSNKMGTELWKVRKQIEGLKIKLEENPDFSTMNELKTLEDSYREYSNMKSRVDDDIQMEKQRIYDQVVKIAKTFMLQSVMEEYQKKREESEKIVKDAALLILDAEQRLLDYRAGVVEAAEAELRANSKIELLDIEGNDWRGIQNTIKYKLLNPALKNE